MNHFRLSRQAERDLEDIWVYLTQQDEILVDKQIAQILDKLPMLSQFPNMGKQREDILVGLRSFPVKPYVIFYKKISDGIEVVRVLHQARDIIDANFSQ
ncbi:type II toxin-antitoxin system RelE/ParE family toxin [Synechocystis sp. PCC 7509]|uniref:type II toxin-antitoxin system RelE/ParE family toxin n=1 Tax=Synechocystis sp. PCC 7509 TaxID=927677 RepID=UPI0002AC8760|nr:type II toxin-antitoxin system RelE/ParE family toxin [Synechocystis sp. PCC 7509]